MVLCDRRVKQLSQVLELCTFARLPTWATAAPFHRRAEIFQRLFHSYLFGSGVPETPMGQHEAMTEDGDLPADPDYRIR